ncbi:hypothetical protein ACS3YM_08230 [Nocardia sp. N13]|jgi:hypothetical protein|uniref:hypothetical protein n=1 Tax=Nocardioides sp. N13(2025) TaxID=3453405 RepID=UPI003F76EEC5
MRIFRRRSGGTGAATDIGTAVGTGKEAALAEARKATASLRRRNAEAERYRAGKQADPANEITAAGLD